MIAVSNFCRRSFGILDRTSPALVCSRLRCYCPPPVQQDSGPPTQLNCANDSIRHHVASIGPRGPPQDGAESGHEPILEDLGWVFYGSTPWMVCCDSARGHRHEPRMAI